MCIRDRFNTGLFFSSISHCFHRKWKTIPTHPNKPTYVNPTRAKPRTNHTRPNDRNQLDSTKQRYPVVLPTSSQTKHLFYRPCPAAKHNVIPPSCYELLHTTPKTTFHRSTTSPSARNTPQQRFGFYQDRTGRSLRTGVRKQRGFQMI